MEGAGVGVRRHTADDAELVVAAGALALWNYAYLLAATHVGLIHREPWTYKRAIFNLFQLVSELFFVLRN